MPDQQSGKGRYREMLSFMKRKIAELRSCTSGNVLVLAGTGCFVLAGGVGLAVDTTQWYLAKRQLQQAVDSAALAAAHTLSQGGVDSYRTAGSDEITRNADSMTITIERLSTSPLNGDWAGNTGAIEVIATTSQALPFSSLFMEAAVTVRSRGVATAVARGQNCVISLAEDGVGINVLGTADIAAGCGVIANSSDDGAVTLVGSSYLDANPISAVGNISASETNYPSDTAILPYGVASADPVAERGLDVPTDPTGCDYNNERVLPRGSQTYSPVSPGVARRFCGGLNIQGEVTFDPGVYIMDGGDLDIASTASVRGEGVTIILTGNAPGNVAAVDIAGGSDVQMTAPDADQDSTWNGILFFQDPDLGSTRESNIAGDSSLNLEGIVYMPGGDVSFLGSSGQSSQCFYLIAERVTIGGEAAIDNNCDLDIDGMNFQNFRIALVE
jgi:Flp pilus assembly protein TadG